MKNAGLVIVWLGAALLEVYKETEESMVAKVVYGGNVSVLKMSSTEGILTQVPILARVNVVAPTPRVIRSGEYLGVSYLVMTHADGVSMEMCTSSIAGDVYEQLGAYVKAIRTLEFPGLCPGTTRDYFVTATSGTEAVDLRPKNFMLARLDGMSVSHEKLPALNDARTVISHCDLHPRNVIISHDGRSLVSIIDWDDSGYYPDFYEYFLYLHLYTLEGIKLDPSSKTWLGMFRTHIADALMPYEREIHRALLRTWRRPSDNEVVRTNYCTDTIENQNGARGKISEKEETQGSKKGGRQKGKGRRR